MADSALTPDPLERYGAIERAYCEERWSAVIYDGQVLLAELDRAVEASPEGLRERLQLLIGHAYLYGLGDRDSAEDLYQLVLRSGAEPSLRQIAEQGLQQCVLPVAPAESPLEDEPLDQQDSSVGLELATSAASVMWSEASAEDGRAAPLDPAASAGLAALTEGSVPLQEPADSWGSGAPQTPPEPTGMLAWLSPEAPAAASVSQAPPVMPWLETGVAAAAMTPSLPEPVSPAPDRAAGDDRQDSSLQEAQLWAIPSSAPAPAGSEPAFSPEPGATPVEPQRAEPLSTAEVAASVLVEASLGSFDPPQAAPVNRAAEESWPAGSLANAFEQRLVADVVEEPELIELHQATAQSEEVVLLPTDADGPGSTSSADAEMALQSAKPWLPTGVDRRGSEPDQGPRDGESHDDGPHDDSPHGLEPQMPLPDASDRELAAAPAPDPVVVAATARVPVAAGRGPFSVPPEPVAEEDPELLMGLLKVEMG